MKPPEYEEFEERFCGKKTYFFFAKRPDEIKDFIKANFIPKSTLRKLMIEELDKWFYRHASIEPDDSHTLVLPEDYGWEEAKADLLYKLTEGE